MLAGAHAAVPTSRASLPFRGPCLHQARCLPLESHLFPASLRSPDVCLQDELDAAHATCKHMRMKLPIGSRIDGLTDAKVQLGCTVTKHRAAELDKTTASMASGMRSTLVRSRTPLTWLAVAPLCCPVCAGLHQG